MSAVDAHVGRLLFNDAILGLRAAGKTVVLVTHALHFLPQVDYVYTVLNGHIVEEGTYDRLMKSGAAFKRLMDEFGGSSTEKEEDEQADEENAIEGGPVDTADAAAKAHERIERKHVGKAAGTGKLEGRLMTSEVRKTGSVGGKIYAAYLKAGKGSWTLPLSIIFAVAM